MEKLAQPVRVGGARPPSFTIVTVTYKVAVYALPERAETLPLFLLYPYILCGPGKGFLPFQTGLYSVHFLYFFFILNVFNVGHPAEAQLYSRLCRLNCR